MRTTRIHCPPSPLAAAPAPPALLPPNPSPFSTPKTTRRNHSCAAVLCSWVSVPTRNGASSHMGHTSSSKIIRSMLSTRPRSAKTIVATFAVSTEIAAISYIRAAMHSSPPLRLGAMSPWGWSRGALGKTLDYWVFSKGLRSDNINTLISTQTNQRSRHLSIDNIYHRVLLGCFCIGSEEVYLN